MAASFLVSAKAKGFVCEERSFFAGVVSCMAIDSDLVETIHAADVVLGAGFDPVECDNQWFAKTEIVSIDSAPMAQGAYQPLEAIAPVEQLAWAPAQELTPKQRPADLLAARHKAIQHTPPE